MCPELDERLHCPREGIVVLSKEALHFQEQGFEVTGTAFGVTVFID
jgi:hypothetical protein